MFVVDQPSLPLLPALLLSLLFILPTWWLWRVGRKGAALFPLIICILLVGLTVAIQLQDTNRTQCKYDVDTLLAELNAPDLWEVTDLTDQEAQLFLASCGSMALLRARAHFPEQQGHIDSTLLTLAQWVTRQGKFRQWQSHRNWDLQAFFLAHAGATLGHYQLATQDAETFRRAFEDIGEHLGQRLRRGRYKHLISRPAEEFFRPADNAAALYALSLYERATGKAYLEPSYKDWSDYLKEELYYAESRLPCAAFSVTNRCQLEPSATASGLYISYRAAAVSTQSDIPWKEWMHYFKTTSFSPFSVSIRHNMRNGEETRFCNQGAQPLECSRYERAIGLWAAAEYGGGYTYFRLFSSQVFQRWFYPEINYASMSSTRRQKALTRLALQTIGTAR